MQESDASDSQCSDTQRIVEEYSGLCGCGGPVGHSWAPRNQCFPEIAFDELLNEAADESLSQDAQRTACDSDATVDEGEAMLSNISFHLQSYTLQTP